MDNPQTPFSQPIVNGFAPQFYSPEHVDWIDVSPSWSPENITPEPLRPQTQLRILSWNVDFENIGGGERIVEAMSYIRSKFGDNPGLLVLMLQEVSAESLQSLLTVTWLRQHFVLVGQEPPEIDFYGSRLPAGYYTLLLLPKALKIRACYRMPFGSTNMGRDGLFADIEVAPAATNGVAANGLHKPPILRLGTVHLESMGGGDPFRLEQLKLVADKLHSLHECDADVNVVAGIVGGDMNAITAREEHWHEPLGLSDMFLVDSPTDHDDDDETVSDEDREVTGHTWGYQSGTTPYPPVRFDKFYYTGIVVPDTLTDLPPNGRRVAVLGKGLKTTITDEDVPHSVFLSDHYAIATAVRIGG